MDQDWKAYLKAQGAQFKGDTLLDFGQRQAELKKVLNSDTLTELTDWGLIAITGKDAKSFLQGQLTCDLNEVNTEQSRLAAYCNPKGRMQCVFRLYHFTPPEKPTNQEDDKSYYLLRLPNAVCEPTIQTLKKYGVFSKVDIEDASDKWTKFGLAGENAFTILNTLSNNALKLTEINQVQQLTISDIPCWVGRLPGRHPRLEIYTQTENKKTLWETLQKHASPVLPEGWLLLEIHAGIPNVFENTREQFLPHHVNLHLVGGISFEKGCYCGQEIIARMQYRGKIKKRMYRAWLDNPEKTPQPFDDIWDQDTQKPIGKIVSSAPAAGGGYECLILLEEAFKNNNRLLHTKNGPPFQQLDLPYAWA